MSSKVIFSLVRPLLRYLPLLPTPLLTLPASLGLHLTTHPSPSFLSFLTSSTTHPLHFPLLFLLGTIPLVYVLGLISGNVSWVDRLWPFFTPICSGLIVAWVWFNKAGGAYGHNLPRLFLMLGLQLAWSARLLSHAIRRDFYNPRGEDYRYTYFRKLVPRPLFSLVHIFVIALAQPALLLALSLPLHAVLILPPSELSDGLGRGALSFGTIAKLLPERFRTAPAGTPVLNLVDLGVTVLALGCLVLEYKADNAMYKYQNGKHSLQSSLPPSQLIKNESASAPPNKKKQSTKIAPYPAAYHPGFPTKGLWKYSRHPNFAGEQLFWLTQALLVVAAGESSAVTRSGWMIGSVFGPCFALSVLFCASTFLTEWITTEKYPTYKSYKRLVGQFLPQETALIWLWGKIRGYRAGAKSEVYDVPRVENRDSRKSQ
ncbi:hypothetical protein CI109_103929 [Kwoniella shandongensis]|uniref:Uncharacterized protein n=1 Tax=Kwoniella shandongensis TaxID=1734106 RepID=A0A5M6BUX6_9TREE|nr:uncharacterized protein CI109_005617 [Kwoniella shandongensis]KAA5526021.1 hypothetical protein CI109_005617 [Kwoniella shandongensis]